ncbi:MAG: ABC transporter ATP-binding protein [bacterium]
MLELNSVKIALKEKGRKEKLLVNNISLKISPSTISAIVGESGSGKSLTAYSIINLLPSSNLKVTGGEIIFNGKNILKFDHEELRAMRGAKIFMIPQDPLTALNPVLTIEEQLEELFIYHTGLDKNEIKKRCLQLLELVKIDNPKARLKAYPHQLSGGQRQRVLIAMSVALNPALIIADEPTTALDVSLQSEIMELFLKIKKEIGTSILLITHDFGIVNMVADYIYVMYGGKIVEEGGKKEILEDAVHPYTVGLKKSVPSLNSVPKSLLPVIKGYAEISDYHCPFYERCDNADDYCKEIFDYKQLSLTHKVLCRKA